MTWRLCEGGIRDSLTVETPDAFSVKIRMYVRQKDCHDIKLCSVTVHLHLNRSLRCVSSGIPKTTGPCGSAVLEGFQVILEDVLKCGVDIKGGFVSHAGVYQRPVQSHGHFVC